MPFHMKKQSPKIAFTSASYQTQYFYYDDYFIALQIDTTYLVMKFILPVLEYRHQPAFL